MRIPMSGEGIEKPYFAPSAAASMVASTILSRFSSPRIACATPHGNRRRRGVADAGVVRRKVSQGNVARQLLQGASAQTVDDAQRCNAHGRPVGVAPLAGDGDVPARRDVLQRALGARSQRAGVLVLHAIRPRDNFLHHAHRHDLLVADVGVHQCHGLLRVVGIFTGEQPVVENVSLFRRIERVDPAIFALNLLRGQEG